MRLDQPQEEKKKTAKKKQKQNKTHTTPSQTCVG